MSLKIEKMNPAQSAGVSKIFARSLGCLSAAPGLSAAPTSLVRRL